MRFDHTLGGAKVEGFVNRVVQENQFMSCVEIVFVMGLDQHFGAQVEVLAREAFKVSQGERRALAEDFTFEQSGHGGDVEASRRLIAIAVVFKDALSFEDLGAGVGPNGHGGSC